MGATEEQMALLAGAHVTHVSYILILFSISFLLFLFVIMLLHLYAAHVWPVDRNPVVLPKVNGRAVGNGHLRGDSQRLRDVEEFELEGLMSDEEDARYHRRVSSSSSSGAGRRKENGRPG